MARTIYTDRDIEEMAGRGLREIDVTDGVYLTDLARERAEKLGIQIRQGAAGTRQEDTTPVHLSAEEKAALAEKVKQGVIARLGDSVDTMVIDHLVNRVVGRL